MTEEGIKKRTKTSDNMTKIKVSDRIEMVPIKDIHPYAKNPRKNDVAVPKVAESIQRFGFRNPIILDKDNTVIAGHTRLAAAKRLKLKEVPCIWAKDLTPDEVKALRLVDNKTAEYSEWDIEGLEMELDDIDLDLSDFDFDMGVELQDGFGEEFSLPEGEKSDIVTMSFTMSTIQMETVKRVLDKVDIHKYETTGPNKNGNALYGVCLEWEGQRT